MVRLSNVVIIQNREFVFSLRLRHLTFHAQRLVRLRERRTNQESRKQVSVTVDIVARLRFVQVNAIYLCRIRRVLSVIIMASLGVRVRHSVSILSPRSILEPGTATVRNRRVHSMVKVVFQSRIEDSQFNRGNVRSWRLGELVVTFDLLLIILVCGRHAGFFRVLERV